MNKKCCLNAGKIGVILGASLLVTMTGCVGYVEQPRARNVYVEPAPVFAVQDDYVYYPRYQMYYGSRSGRYYYQDGPAWVAHPVPRGVSLNVLVASPSVRVDFHDGPAAHHSHVSRTYPQHWTPHGGNHDRRTEQR